MALDAIPFGLAIGLPAGILGCAGRVPAAARRPRRAGGRARRRHDRLLRRRRVPQRALGRSFAALVAAVAGYPIVAAAFLGGPPGS